MKNILCKSCNKEFEPKKANQIFCSCKCRYKANSKKYRENNPEKIKIYMKKEEKNLWFILSNKIRLYTLMILINSDNKKITISGVYNFFKSEQEKYDYKSVYKQIKQLEKLKIIELKKEEKEQGKPVYLKLIEKRTLANFIRIACEEIADKILNKILIENKREKGVFD